MKKAILVVFSLFFFVTYLSAQSWNQVLAPEITKTLNDIAMVSDSELWAVGEDGFIVHTTDGFETIDTVTLGDGSDFNKIVFIDSDNGWIGSEAGSVFYTTDGGNVWTESSFEALMPDGFTFSYFDGLEFVNDTLGFALAGKYKSNYLFKTIDGGETWAIKDSMANVTSSSDRWYDIAFYDENNGVVAGQGKGTQKYTTDGGETWAIGDSAVMSAMGGCTLVWLSENEVIYAAQGNSYQGFPLPIFKSADGGVTWTNYSDMTNLTYDRAYGAYFKDSENGIVVGHNGFRKMFMYKTTDGGETWEASVGKYSLALSAVVGNGDLLYALGTSGHVLKSEDFGATWELKYFDNGSPFVAMQFTNGKGFVLNRYSDLLVSSTGNAANWEVKSSAGKWEAGAMYFLNASTGIAVKENRTILKTVDGGETWSYVLEPVEFSSFNKVGGITFVDDQTGYVWFSVSDVNYGDYSIYKTTDGGDNWSEVSQFEGPGYISGGIEFFDANAGFIAGPHFKDTAGVYQNWIVYSEDGGVTWDTADVSAVPAEFQGESFDGVAKVNETTAFVVGGSSVLKTTDKGKTWSNVDFNVTLNDTDFYRVAFNGDFGIVSTYDGEMLITEDGGSTWTLDQENYDVFSPYVLAVSENGEYYFGTNDGYIYGYYDPTGVEDEPASGLTKEFSLAQNYPNPFNPTTTINFSIPQNEVVTLKIYNVLGQEVKTLINEQMRAGAHKINFDASKLASGVYIYSIKAGSFTAAKKMMLMK